MSDVSTRLDKIIGEFADLDAREKLELLVDFANGLQPLPPEYEGKRGTARIHECQTPVFLWMEADDRGSRLVAEVAPEAPTVKGFVAILAEAVAGRPAAEAAALPENMLERMGLADVLGILRSRGLRSIIARVSRGFAAVAAG